MSLFSITLETKEALIFLWKQTLEEVLADSLMASTLGQFTQCTWSNLPLTLSLLLKKAWSLLKVSSIILEYSLSKLSSTSTNFPVSYRKRKLLKRMDISIRKKGKNFVLSSYKPRSNYWHPYVVMVAVTSSMWSVIELTLSRCNTFRK